jgi:hypothetical protein
MVELLYFLVLSSSLVSSSFSSESSSLFSSSLLEMVQRHLQLGASCNISSS